MSQFYDAWTCRTPPMASLLPWQRKEDFCTYTRELTVDLPDLDKAES